MKEYLLQLKFDGQPLVQEKDFEEVFDQIDSNHDGKISFEEFALFQAFTQKETSAIFKDMIPVFKVVSS